MIMMIGGASYTGKTLLAQRLLERYHYPYLSIDHLKMGLIRSGQTELTPEDDDEELTAYLWPIVREMRYVCLVMSEGYIRSRFADILEQASVIERRPDDSWCTVETLIEENCRNLQLCRKHGRRYVLIEDSYEIGLPWEESADCGETFAAAPRPTD